MIPIDLSRVAEVLDLLGEEVEALGRQLCADPALVSSYLTEMQAIDRIAQHQHALASLLRADCMSSAINTLGLEELAHRLRAQF